MTIGPEPITRILVMSFLRGILFLSINFATMTDGKCQDDEFLVL